MDASGLDLNTLVTVGLFAAGYFLAKWDRDRTAQTKSVQVDTELRQRVINLEEKMREQVGHGPSITRLEAMVQNMARDLHELRSFWMLNTQAPYHLRQPHQHQQQPQPSPFNFPGARDWIERGEGA